MSCITYINNDPSGLPVTVSGITCMQVMTAVTLNFGQAICMDNDHEIITCGNADIGAPCINPVPPSPTPTTSVTPTPTCPTYSQQYLEVVLQSCHNFKLVLWNNPNFTSAANAVCDVVVSGCAYGNMGTYYCGTETILATQHQYNFSLQPVLQPGECVSSFSVLSVNPVCDCYDVVYVPPTPTPTPTPSVTPTHTPTSTNTPTITSSHTPTQTPTQTEGLTPTPTATATQTPTNSQTPTQTPTNTTTPTQTPTPSETSLGGTLNVYARYVNTSQEFGYTINGGTYYAIGEPTSSNCLFAGTITGLQNNDLVSFVTLFTCGINGDTADCPNSVGSCLWNYTFNGSTTVYITVDGSQCC